MIVRAYDRYDRCGQREQGGEGRGRGSRGIYLDNAVVLQGRYWVCLGEGALHADSRGQAYSCSIRNMFIFQHFECDIHFQYSSYHPCFNNLDAPAQAEASSSGVEVFACQQEVVT